MQGKSGGEALNGAFNYGGDAGRYGAQVTDAFLGTAAARPLAAARRRPAGTFGALASTRGELQGLIANFNDLHRRPRRRSPTTSRRRSGCWRRRCRPRARRWSASTPRCRRCAPARSSSGPAVAELPATIAAGPAVARPGAAAALAGARSAASPSCSSEATPGSAAATQATRSAAARS